MEQDGAGRVHEGRPEGREPEGGVPPHAESGHAEAVATREEVVGKIVSGLLRGHPHVILADGQVMRWEPPAIPEPDEDMSDAACAAFADLLRGMQGLERRIEGVAGEVDGLVRELGVFRHVLGTEFRPRLKQVDEWCMELGASNPPRDARIDALEVAVGELNERLERVEDWQQTAAMLCQVVERLERLEGQAAEQDQAMGQWLAEVERLESTVGRKLPGEALQAILAELHQIEHSHRSRLARLETAAGERLDLAAAVGELSGKVGRLDDWRLTFRDQAELPESGERA